MNWEQDNQAFFNDGANDGLFTIKGDLDGEEQQEFVEREQFIGLVIAQEEFLMPISAVREINMLVPITYVPNGPRFIDGVINLRGTILPVINIRKMMGMTRAEPSQSTRIIITRSEDITFGLLVDDITYVVSLLPSEIEYQSLPGKGTGAEFIGAISKHGEKVCGILDLQRIVRVAGGGSLDETEDEGLADEQ